MLEAQDTSQAWHTFREAPDSIAVAEEVQARCDHWLCVDVESKSEQQSLFLRGSLFSVPALSCAPVFPAAAKGPSVCLLLLRLCCCAVCPAWHILCVIRNTYAASAFVQSTHELNVDAAVVSSFRLGLIPICEPIGKLVNFYNNDPG
jgi:hypothetical protein